MSTDKLPTDEQYIQAAFDRHNRDGELEIDLHYTGLPTSRVSRGESDPGEIGAYVMAWVWVYKTDVPGFEDSEDED